MRFRFPSLLPLLPLLATAAACGPSQGARSPNRAPLAEKWFQRATQAYKSGDFDDARESAKQALQASSSDPEIRLLNARLALLRVDFAEALKLTEGMQTTEAHGIRGRAFWYNGDIEQTADELDAMLQDPSVRDPWASEVAKLARRGVGRHPFEMEGGMVAAVDMPRAGPALIVPCELEGEQVLAMVATASGDVVVDSNSRREAAWVNLRFGDRIEVHDVPALTQDLSSLSRQFGAPIRMLLGVNFLRHAHVTFDRRGDQFVIRREDSPAPPDSMRVPIWYVRGGAMVMRVGIGPQKTEPVPLVVDTSVLFPVGLTDAAWQKAGVDVAKLQPEPSMPSVKSGAIPMMTIGGFDLPQIPAVAGAPVVAELQSNVDVDIGGVAGAGILALFRVTLGDEGRFMWLEPDPTMLQGGPPGRGAAPPGAAAPPSPTPDIAPAAPATPAKPGGKPSPSLTPAPKLAPPDRGKK